MEFYSAYNHPKTEPTNAGDENRRTYMWKENENGEKVLVEDEIINIHDEIESYHEETKITNIIRRATFDIDAANRLIGDNGAGGADMTQMPENLMEAQNLMVKAKMAYAALTPKQQAEFNGLSEYMATAGTEEWAKKLGYITEKPVKEETKSEQE
jgi:precorrin isomerase